MCLDFLLPIFLAYRARLSSGLPASLPTVGEVTMTMLSCPEQQSLDITVLMAIITLIVIPGQKSQLDRVASKLRDEAGCSDSV